jgi:peptidoglycan hydrolase-like protein with peptidoglycan-binding domain
MTEAEALAEGSHGEQVEQLQTTLNMSGATLKVDGVFGEHTAEAVKKFQTDHGLHVDGIVGPLTRAALSKV